MSSKQDTPHPTTYAPPAPPTAANAAAVQASADARQRASEKQGLNSTLLGASANQKTIWNGDVNKGTATANEAGPPPVGTQTLLGMGGASNVPDRYRPMLK